MPINRNFAPFACNPAHTMGRLYKEPVVKERTPFHRDRDRIIHSTAFRRLKHKTQVFVYHEGDHYRTRLTHSLEVAQIARSMAYVLGLCEELAEAISLAHDLGHTPFGHAGEDALNAVMEPYGGFDHNENSLKMVTLAEKRYAEFDGLNLTWETLEGLVKHNGPVTGDKIRPGIAAYNEKYDLRLDTFASAEAQVAALADDIAYNNHDIEDGLRAGLFSMEQVRALPVVGTMFSQVADLYPDIEESRLIHEAIRRMINAMVGDVVETTRKNIEEFGIETPEDVRLLDRPVVDFSPKMKENNKQIKSFLMQNMYRHYKVNRMVSKAHRTLTNLFNLFLEEPQCLPTEWRSLAGDPKTTQTANVVADYIAGMTDKFALEEYRRLFNL